MADTTEISTRRSGRILKLIVLLFVGSTCLSFGIVFGSRWLYKTVDFISLMPFMNQRMEDSVAESQFSSIKPPQGFSYAKVYRKLFGDKNIEMFLVTQNGESETLPKKDQEALRFPSFHGPVFYLIGLRKTEGSIDAAYKEVNSQIGQEGPSITVQEKIWISEKEKPVLIRETNTGGKTYVTLLTQFSPRGLLLAAYPKEVMAEAPARELLAAVWMARPEEISFQPPEPPAMKLARLIATGELMERKQSVTNLAGMENQQPEAVDYLAKNLPIASDAAKPDIVAALGLLSKKNPQAIAPLIASLNDKSVRLEAMTALATLGTEAIGAVGGLKKIALNKREPKAVRQAAKKALDQIQGRSTKKSSPHFRNSKRKRG